MNQPGRLVRVWWYDHVGDSAWSEDLDEPELCCTVGFLISETDRFLQLASSYNDSGQTGSRETIVRGAVASIEDVE